MVVLTLLSFFFAQVNFHLSAILVTDACQTCFPPVNCLLSLSKFLPDEKVRSKFAD